MATKPVVPTVVSGAPITAAFGNTVKAATDWANSPKMAWGRRTDSFPVALTDGSLSPGYYAGTPTQVLDTDNMLVGTGRLQVNSPGVYFLYCDCSWGAGTGSQGANGVRSLMVYTTDGTLVAWDRQWPDTGVTVQCKIFQPIGLSAGTTLEVRVSHDAGGAATGQPTSLPVLGINFGLFMVSGS